MGNILRKTSLDELPQILNIINGSMSLVGNRPYLPREKEDIHSFFDIIVSTKPEITGYWQVSGRSNVSFNERLKLEKYYSENPNLKMYIKIFFKTFKVVFGMFGAKWKVINMDIGKIKVEKKLGNNKRINILGVNIDVLNTKETIELVEKYVKLKEPLHLMGVNADKINESIENPKLMEIVNKCGVINADGASVVMASKYLGKPLPERVAGIDLMQDLVSLSAEKEYSIYLLGAKKEVVEKTRQVLLEKYPKLKIVGIRDGYFKDDEWNKVAKELEKIKPDFVFVGITSPKKEYLIEYLQNKNISSVFMGVGGSFDVLSGNIPRAPKWMQNCNLEWLFRVIQEPKRLFKRYFVGNTKFIKNIIKEKRSK